MANYIFSETSTTPNNQILLQAGSGKYITDILHVLWSDEQADSTEPKQISNTNDFLRLLKYGIEQVHSLISSQTISKIAWKDTVLSSTYGSDIEYTNIIITYEDGSTNTIRANSNNVTLDPEYPNTSSNAETYSNLTAAYQDQITKNIFYTENKLTYTIYKAEPELTIGYPDPTTVADGGTTIIIITSDVEGQLTLSKTRADNWSWQASVVSDETKYKYNVKIVNSLRYTDEDSISVNDITATFTPTDTTNYTILENINVIKEEITLSAKDDEVTYYWYVGQTNPSTMSSISGTADYNNGGGWTSTGNSVPETIYQLVKGFDSSKEIFVAVPITSGTTLKPVASDMSTIDTSVHEVTTKTLNGVNYQIYTHGTDSIRKTIMYAKK